MPETLDVNQMLANSFEPKRKFRFVLQIDGIDAYTLKTAARPQATFDETVIDYLNAKRYVAEGLALIGDAAHVIHPLAGQGVNLGFLDAAVLAEVLLSATERGERLADVKVLSRYERRRMPHNLALMAAMSRSPW